MINNEFKFIGVALSNYEINGKVAKFNLELTKQKSGEPYSIELLAYTNSKSIKFDENIKGKLVAVIGFIAVNDKAQIQLNVTNVMSLTASTNAPAKVKDVPVVTSQDLESKEIEINDDDLPF